MTAKSSVLFLMACLVIISGHPKNNRQVKKIKSSLKKIEQRFDKEMLDLKQLVMDRNIGKLGDEVEVESRNIAETVRLLSEVEILRKDLGEMKVKVATLAQENISMQQDINYLKLCACSNLSRERDISNNGSSALSTHSFTSRLVTETPNISPKDSHAETRNTPSLLPTSPVATPISESSTKSTTVDTLHPTPRPEKMTRIIAAMDDKKQVYSFDIETGRKKRYPIFSENTHDIIYDSIYRRIIWTNFSLESGGILSKPLDADYRAPVKTHRRGDIYGLAIDVARRLLFFTDYTVREIRSINLLSEKENLIISTKQGGYYAYNLALHTQRKLIFWSQTDRVCQVSYSGENHKILSQRSKEMFAVTIDEERDIVYYASGYSVWTYNITTSSHGRYWESRTHEIWDMLYYQEHLYMTTNGGAIRKMSTKSKVSSVLGRMPSSILPTPCLCLAP